MHDDPYAARLENLRTADALALQPLRELLGSALRRLLCGGLRVGVGSLLRVLKVLRSLLRLLVCLREPVDRAFSDYLDLRKNQQYDGPFDGALDSYPRERPDLFRADAIVVCDAGNVRPGVPTLTTALRGDAALYRV